MVSMWNIVGLRQRRKGVYLSSTTVVRPCWWPGARTTFIQSVLGVKDIGMVLFCFKSNAVRRPERPMQDKRKDQILSSWTEPPFEASQVRLPPNPPYVRKKEEKEKSTHKKGPPVLRERRLNGVQLIT
jgi:hypothetical protein